MRLIVISLLAMFLAVSPALANPQEDVNKGLSAYVDGNYKTAIKLFHQAAEQGHAWAQTSLGFMYKYGEGVAQDYKTAIKWYHQAAKQGNAAAQYFLGVMYKNGQGVAQDYKQAVKLFHQAAEQGDADAQFNLGLMYNQGQGVVKDYKQAAKWLHQAAEQGNARAQGYLGAVYGLGEGVIRNGQTAYMFYLLALANIKSESMRETIEKTVTSMESRLTATQIQSAQNDAVKYQAKIDAR